MANKAKPRPSRKFRLVLEEVEDESIELTKVHRRWDLTNLGITTYLDEVGDLLIFGALRLAVGDDDTGDINNIDHPANDTDIPLADGTNPDSTS